MVATLAKLRLVKVLSLVLTVVTKD
jgi:hypothetical protein